MVYEPQPTPTVIPTFASSKVVKVACGHNHTIAADQEGSVFTWGNGGYGR